MAEQRRRFEGQPSVMAGVLVAFEDQVARLAGVEVAKLGERLFICSK
jgi:hypothetical protein